MADWLDPIVELNRKLGAMPMVGGNSATMYAEDAESLDAMTEEIGARQDDRARRVLHPVARRARPSPSSTRSPRAVERGVTVRVLLDHLGTLAVQGIPPRQARLDGDGRAVAPHAAVPAAARPHPAPRPAQPPQAPGHRRRDRVHRIAEHHRPRLRASAATPGADCTGRTSWCASRGRWSPGIDALFVTDWYSETDELLVARGRAGTRRTGPGAARLPGRAERPGLRGREQPAPVQLARLRGPEEGHPGQPLLRARRLDALRDHDGRAVAASRCSCSSRRSATSSSSTTRSAATTRRCCGPACASSSTRRRRSCTPSTSPSTTRSR